MPISSSARMASGFTRDGCDPADETVPPAGASDRAIPSASWLRAELATQRKRTWRGASSRSSSASGYQLASVMGSPSRSRRGKPPAQLFAPASSAVSPGKKRSRSLSATVTSPIRTGTSTSGPITAANAAPCAMPNVATATAMASSKLFEAAVKESVAVWPYEAPTFRLMKKDTKNMSTK